MGETTKIEWCHHTWSPWRGCTKVSPGCTKCYAEALSKRNPDVLGEWGPNGKRSENKDWNRLFIWDRAAAKAGERHRVFPSLCDPFEDRVDLDGHRARLLESIERTPNLDWLLLTKRPENWRPLMQRLADVGVRRGGHHLARRKRQPHQRFRCYRPARAKSKPARRLHGVGSAQRPCRRNGRPIDDRRRDRAKPARLRHP